MAKEEEMVQVPLKHLIGSVAVIITSVTIIATLHASYVVPAIMFQVSELIDKKIIEHSKATHLDAVDHEDMARIHEQLAEIRKRLP